MERLTIKGDKSKLIYTKFSLDEIMTKLAEYEDLEEQGLLLKLPCKIGDNLYKIIQGEIFELRLDEIRRNRCIEGAVTLCCEVEGKRWDRRYIDSNE